MGFKYNLVDFQTKLTVQELRTRSERLSYRYTWDSRLSTQDYWTSLRIPKNSPETSAKQYRTPEELPRSPLKLLGNLKYFRGLMRPFKDSDKKIPGLLVKMSRTPGPIIGDFTVLTGEWILCQGHPHRTFTLTPYFKGSLGKYEP